MKKILVTLSITMNILSMGVAISHSNMVEAKEKIEIEKTWYKENGDMIIELNDGSWACYNPEKEKYHFQPVNMGDWDYEFDNKKHLEQAVQTYINIANGLGW